jgi:hypothetical protein
VGGGVHSSSMIDVHTNFHESLLIHKLIGWDRHTVSLSFLVK